MIFYCFSAINPVSSGLFLLHLSLSRFAQVKLVANQDDWNHQVLLATIVIIIIWNYTFHEVISPLFNSLVAVSIGYIVNYYTAVCSAIEGVTQALKTFLAGSIPYLQRNDFSTFYFNLLLNEIGPNSWLVTETWFFILI